DETSETAEIQVDRSGECGLNFQAVAVVLENLPAQFSAANETEFLDTALHQQWIASEESNCNDFFERDLALFTGVQEHAEFRVRSDAADKSKNTRVVVQPDFFGANERSEQHQDQPAEEVKFWGAGRPHGFLSFSPAASAPKEL